MHPTYKRLIKSMIVFVCFLHSKGMCMKGFDIHNLVIIGENAIIKLGGQNIGYVLGQDPKEGVTINITSIEDAGAVCLGGSPETYFYGEGANNLIVYLQGGGWCESEGECVQRSNKMIHNLVASSSTEIKSG